MSLFKSISSTQAEKLIKDSSDLIIIDVRRYSEFKQGKIPNAINIPVEELEWEIEELKENIDKPILVYCKAGHKSALACQMLEEEGFNNLYNLGQGILGYKGDME
ncbi:MAG: rhodanese-like domain-containing protein [Clostridium sp.]|nr:rhodanese-like domain-containing protein [Clostridium sp.]